MRDHTWESADEREFDAMLENSLPELPPAEVVQQVTPWRRAMNRVLVGLALNTITLEFCGLQYILPAAGLLLMLLGLRSLRGENRWLQGCFILTVVKAACFWPLLVLNATIYRGAVYDGPGFVARITLEGALMLLFYFCFWRGLRSVRQKAGLPGRAGGAAALLVWYVAMILLALWCMWQGGGLASALVMLLAYIFIIRSLFGLSRELDEAGYAIQPLPVRVTDSAMVGIILGVLAAGIACGYLFFSSYPMDWRAAEPSTDAEAAEVRAQLLDLGFPEEVLNDLSEEDVLACAGARKVLVRTDDLPLDENGGYMVAETQADGSEEERMVYDVKELRLTGVAVALSGERWRVFHHFLWTVDPGFYGTEALLVYPDYFLDGWTLAGNISGRLLYERAGQTYTAAYDSIESMSYTGNRFFFEGDPVPRQVFANFSLPREGTGKRGYVAYEVQSKEGAVTYHTCLAGYMHQVSWMQYPVRTAMEESLDSSWLGGAFKMIGPGKAYVEWVEDAGAAEG
ncbi:MAG: hypothetical protein ACI3WR_00035 [Oscillospiraceae bacterium]